MADTRVCTVRLTVTREAWDRIIDAMRDGTDLFPGAEVGAISSADVFAERDEWKAIAGYEADAAREARGRLGE